LIAAEEMQGERAVYEWANAQGGLWVTTRRALDQNGLRRRREQRD
jgi:hypothetical protein